jgi:hypothetical protein
MSKRKPARQHTEGDIPLAAGKAFRQARLAALRAGHTVLVIENGKLIKIEPGQEEQVVRVIGTVDAGKIRFKKDEKTKIRWADSPG